MAPSWDKDLLGDDLCSRRTYVRPVRSPRATRCGPAAVIHMSLIDFIRTVEESQDEFDVELEEFDPDSEQADAEDAASGGRSYGRLFLVALLLVGVAYVVYRLRSSSSDEELFTDIELDEEADEAAADEEPAEEATVSVEHDPEEAADEEPSEEAEAADDEHETAAEEADASDEAVEVEIESPDADTDDEE